MTKISKKKLDSDKTSELIDQLWRAVTLLESKDEVRKFLFDLLSRTEIQMLAKRLAVVKRLNEGASYLEIRRELSVTDTTIAKINNWYEAFGDGYRIVVDRLHRLEKEKRGAKFQQNEDKRIVTGQTRAVQQAWVGAGKELYKTYKRIKKRKSAS